MRLQEYLNWQKLKANVWAEQVGLPISSVYAWLTGTLPSLPKIMAIKKATNGNVGPEDWVDGEK